MRETKCPESCRSENKRVNTGGILEETPEVNLVPGQAGRPEEGGAEQQESGLITKLQLSLFTLPRSHTGTGARRYAAGRPQRPIRRSAIQITIPRRRGGRKSHEPLSK